MAVGARHSETGKGPGLVSQPRFYWATAFAGTVVLLASAVMAIDWDPAEDDPKKLTPTQSDNLRSVMVVVIVGAIVAWLLYLLFLWRRRSESDRRRDDDLFTQLWEECAGMATYALQRGIPIEPADVQKIAELRDLARSGPGSRSDEKLREAAPLTDTHRRLAEAVDPAKPMTLRLLNPPDDSEDTCVRAPVFEGLGRIRLVRRLVGLVCVLIPVFLLLAVSVGARLDESTGALFDGSPIDKFESVVYLFTASALGAAFAALFKAFRYIENLSYDPKWESSYWVRFILGIVAGLILSTIVAQTFFETEAAGTGGDTASNSAFRVTIPLLALVGGFSSDLVYRILKRVIDAIETLVRGSASERIDIEVTRANTVKERLVLANRKELAGEIIGLRAELVDHPAATAALDASLVRILEGPPAAPTFGVRPLSPAELVVEPGRRVDIELTVGANRAADVVAVVSPPDRGTVAPSGPPPGARWTFTAAEEGDGPVQVLFAIPATREQAMVELTIGEPESSEASEPDGDAGGA